MFKSVLIICTGNICRSPYGEAKFKQLRPDLEVESAGIGTKISRLQGKPADTVASKVALEFGIDIGKHKAKQVTKELVDKYDLILVMEQEQLDELKESIPIASRKTFLLGHWIDVERIDDPYRQGLHAFRHAFMTIDLAIEAWLQQAAEA